MFSVQEVQDALVQAGLEIYQTSNGALHLAERVRLHLMDSDVRVHVNDALQVEFTARAQRSDAPAAASDELLARVRDGVGSIAIDRGYSEACARAVEVTDPMDSTRVLDVWHEVIYKKDISKIEDAIEETRWALAVDKCVQPDTAG